jgi:uncharacterized membrane protein YedE/YeeE
MKQSVVTFAVGFVFAIGLGVAGMTQPQKVIAFLDVLNWDPSLLFVMLGAIVTHALLYPVIRRRDSPLFDTKWQVPTRQDITPRLIIGSGLFGIGWGLGGYCPGPALTSLASGNLQTIAFVAAMFTGMWLFQKTTKYLPLKA